MSFFSKQETRKRNIIFSVICGLAIVVVGFTLFISRASGSYASVEAEEMSLSGGASLISDSSASSGTAIAFGAATTSTTTTTSSSLFQPMSLGLSPYAYLSWGGVNMTTYQNNVGNKNFFAAFMLSAGGCTPAWDGDSSLGLSSSTSSTIASQIQTIQANGGDVAISFGGEGGTELASTCTNATSLAAAYQSIVTKYGTKHLNFDLENSGNYSSNSVRVQALAALQKADPSIKVSLTLPVSESGIPSEPLAMVQQMHDGGVVISGVHVMTMYFGVSASAELATIEQALTSTATQLQNIYSDASSSDIWKGMGAIPQLGTSSGSEAFSISDASGLLTFAQQKGLGTLSFWSANRDQSCSNNSETDSCSGVTQTAYQFGKTMNMSAIE